MVSHLSQATSLALHISTGTSNLQMQKTHLEMCCDKTGSKEGLQGVNECFLTRRVFFLRKEDNLPGAQVYLKAETWPKNLREEGHIH